MKRFFWILPVLAAGTLLAAEWPNGSAKNHGYLEVTLANKTSQDIQDAAVHFGEFRCTKGIVGAGSSGTYLGWQLPVTTNAVVRWTDAHGTKKEQAVKLVGVYNPKVDGGLTFTVGATNVTV